MHQIGRDLAFGIRLLRRAPGFAVISALVVALGIGTTTAIFSVVYGVMLRPLPYAEPERLVALWTRLPNAPQRVRVNPADHRELRSSNTAFEDVALANAPQNFNLIGSGEPERLVAARLSSNLFSVLGVSPALGRAFTSDEEQSGNDRVVLLSDGLWRRRFGADPSIVGRTIDLSGNLYEIVGVMRPNFQFADREHQLWIPLTINPRLLAREYRTDEQIAAFYTRIVDRVAALPGVISAAMVNRLPMAANNQVLAFEIEGVTGDPVSLQSRSVTPDYFRTMSIPVREGRVFSVRDSAKAPLVGVIDDRVARTLWPDESAVGKRFRVARPGQLPTWGEVVGVVANIRHRGLDSEEDRQIYFSYQQFTDGRIALVVRSRTDVRGITPAVLQAIRPSIPSSRSMTSGRWTMCSRVRRRSSG